MGKSGVFLTTEAEILSVLLILLLLLLVVVVVMAQLLTVTAVMAMDSTLQYVRLALMAAGMAAVKRKTFSCSCVAVEIYYLKLL